MGSKQKVASEHQNNLGEGANWEIFQWVARNRVLILINQMLDCQSCIVPDPSNPNFLWGTKEKTDAWRG